MNTFDLVVCLIAIVAVVTSFNAGLLRSVASILGYITATPLAVAATSWISPATAGQSSPAGMTQGSLVFCVVFIVGGLVFGALLRTGIDETIGPSRSIPDRLAGALFGFVRIGLVATTVVLVFDRIIPAGQDPAFLQGSQVRPVLSAVGRVGVKSLPPDVVNYIDQVKQQRS
jgi:membrane protein required for colicin V production